MRASLSSGNSLVTFATDLMHSWIYEPDPVSEDDGRESPTLLCRPTRRGHRGVLRLHQSLFAAVDLAAAVAGIRASAAEISTIITVSTLAVALTAPFTGTVADVLGRNA